MLTKQESKVLHELLNKEGLHCRKALEDVIWANEHDPKYKVGECYRVTDRGCTICGKQVVNFKGKVKEVMYFRNSKMWRYGFDLEVECKGRKHTSYLALDEYEVGSRVKDNLNILDDGDENEGDTIALHL